MSRFFGLQIEPNAQSAFQHDYWEEFSKVNDVFTHEPDVDVVQVSTKSNKKVGKSNKEKLAVSAEESASKSRESSEAKKTRTARFKRFIKEKRDSAKSLVFKNENRNKGETVDCELNVSWKADKGGDGDDEKAVNFHSTIYPDLAGDYELNNKKEGESQSKENGKGATKSRSGQSSSVSSLSAEEDEEMEKFVSVAVQTEMSYMRDVEEVLPYSCCFCCRSSTPCIVWAFVGISLIFFKMGAIVTGRWIYLSQTSFDEIVFYIAFTVCLAFATFYFRHGTKYHNPFDLMFLVLTVPLMWGLLAFTTFFLKKDYFFYAGSVIYTVFIIPYIAMGIYIAYRFWSTGKLFLRRVEGDRPLEPLCRKLFFAISLMIFDGQLSICASIISMSSTVNYQESKHVWISSLIFGPISICLTIAWLIIGYFAMRNENKILTWIFSVLSANQFILIVGMLLKRPRAPGGQFLFVNVAMVFSTTIVLSVHICLLVVIWNWIVPNFGKGLKGAIRRTSRNNCIQCAQLTICR